jgi:putative membrane protein
VTRADRYPLVLLGLFTVFWALLAVAPWYRQDWLLENLLVFVAVPLLALTARSLRFSNFAYTCLFAFFVLHEIGAHYTYSEVPWRDWLQALGVDASRFAGRNHYDRLVHFSYGFLLLPASWELFQQRAAPTRIWRYILPVTFLMAHSVIYELVEWAAAGVFGGDLGQAYLGTQGDTWDAQKDMALASLGAVAGLTVMVARERMQRAVRA